MKFGIRLSENWKQYHAVNPIIIHLPNNISVYDNDVDDDDDDDNDNYDNNQK